MNRKIRFLGSAIAMVLATMSIIACNKFLSASDKGMDITGTWKLDSYKYGNTNMFLPAEADRQYIKVITANTFLWVHYDVSTGKIFKSAGGSCVLDNGNYTESLVYGLGMDRYLNTDCYYKVKSEDDMLFMTGELSDGLHIEEVWRKIN